MQRLWVCRNSIGSSIVTMWRGCSRLILSIIVASVVDLPTRRARHEDEAAGLVAERLDDGGNAQLAEAEDFVGDLPEDGRDGAALQEDVTSEAREALDAEGEVQLEVFLEAVLLDIGEDE